MTRPASRGSGTERSNHSPPERRLHTSVPKPGGRHSADRLGEIQELASLAIKDGEYLVIRGPRPSPRAIVVAIDQQEGEIQIRKAGHPGDSRQDRRPIKLQGGAPLSKICFGRSSGGRCHEKPQGVRANHSCGNWYCSTSGWADSDYAEQVADRSGKLSLHLAGPHSRWTGAGRRPV